MTINKPQRKRAGKAKMEERFDMLRQLKADEYSNSQIRNAAMKLFDVKPRQVYRILKEFNEQENKLAKQSAMNLCADLLSRIKRDYHQAKLRGDTQETTRLSKLEHEIIKTMAKELPDAFNPFVTSY